MKSVTLTIAAYRRPNCQSSKPMNKSLSSFVAWSIVVLPIVGCGTSSNTSSSAAAAVPASTSASTGATKSNTTSPGTTTSGTTTIPTDSGTTPSGTTTSGTATTPTSSGATPSGTTTIPGTISTATSSTPVSATVKKSISGWVSCDGTSDQAAGVARAFAEAKNAAFTVVVDCPVLIQTGSDIAQPIFIDNGTAVEFTGSGKFTVDNVFIPAFVIANSSNVTLTNWKVEYNASVPVNPLVGGYVNRGQFIPGVEPGSAFNDLRITPWLTANRGIKFDRSLGSVNSIWSDPTNTCAVFFVIGDTSNLNVTGMQVYVPATAGGERFVPVVFALSPNFKSNQTVTARTPMTGQYVAVPHDLTFSNISFDGTYMGWVGSARNAVFENIRSHRYGDLQDAKGENVGGVGKWFAPPHLFYLGHVVGADPSLTNTNIQIVNVVDGGPRVGTARDKGGTDSISGYALSLKIGCVDCIVDSYSSSRPDGFMDVLPSNGLTVSNVVATYNSAFLNNLYNGWRFPSAGYANMTFENISLKDSAASSVAQPVGNAGASSNENLVFTNVQVEINRWSGNNEFPLPVIAGSTNNVSLNYTIAASKARVLASQRGTGSVQFLATPATLSAGGSTVLVWISRQNTSCSGDGGWTGALASAGSRVVKLTVAGIVNFTMNCQNTSSSSTTTMPIVVN
jgi:hypothetical protein